MLKLRNQRLDAKQAFTLIEILIVVAIIGILASIALIGLGGTRVKARDSKRIAEVRQIQSALELYFNRCGWYPGEDNCGASFAAPADWAAVRSALTTGLGVTNVPATDPGGDPYLYAVDSAGDSYILGATLEADNLVLKDDIDDATGYSPAIDCADDPAGPKFNYCVQF